MNTRQRPMPRRFTHGAADGPEPMDVKGWVGLPDIKRSGPAHQPVLEFRDEPGRSLTLTVLQLFLDGETAAPKVAVLRTTGLAEQFESRAAVHAISQALSDALMTLGEDIVSSADRKVGHIGHDGEWYGLRLFSRPDASVFAWSPDSGSPVEPAIKVFHRIIKLALENSMLKPFPESGLQDAISDSIRALADNQEET